jgi:hypothetical protein
VIGFELKTTSGTAISRIAPHRRHVREEDGGMQVKAGGRCMTDEDYARKIDELDRLLNDPDVSMQPDRIWSLLADVSHRDNVVGSLPQTCCR